MLDGGSNIPQNDFGHTTMGGNMLGYIFFWSFFFLGGMLGMIGTQDVYYIMGSLSFAVGTLILVWTTFFRRNKK